MSRNSKKPTIMQVKAAIERMIEEINESRYYMQQLDSVIAAYINFKDEETEFKAYLKEKYERKTDDKSKEKRSKKAGSPSFVAEPDK